MNLFTNTNCTGKPVYKKISQHVKGIATLLLCLSFLMSDSFAQSPPACQIAVTDAHTDAVCNGQANGTITINFSGGTGPYQVSLNGAAFTTYTSPAIITGLPATTYNYVVRDANNCSVSGSEIVAQPTGITGIVTIFNVNCTQVAAAFAPSGGTPPYLISNGPTVVGNTNGNPITISSTGIYTVTDGNGCTTVIQIIVPTLQPSPPPIFVAHTDVLCHGGSSGTVTINFGEGLTAEVSFDGGPFAFRTTPAVYTGLPTKTYNYIVRSTCFLSAGSETVGQPAPITITDGHTNALCNEPLTGSITVKVSGGTGPYEVQFPGRELSIISSPTAVLVYSGLAAGTYNYFVRDQNNCRTGGSETVGTQSCVYFGCSPGFWKNHEELWDDMNDPVITNMAALGGPVFTTNTPVATVFGFLPSGYPSGITMRGMISQGGGQCKAFGRHAVAALLSSASGLNIDYPDGANNHTTLFNLIRQALLTGNCSGSLSTQLTQISEADNKNCGAVIPVLYSRNATGEIPAPSRSEGLTVTTYPNPYKDVISFKIQTAVSGKGILDIYNLTGQKLKTVYEGNLVAGKLQTIQTTVPLQNRETIIYRLSVGGKTATGKLLYID